LDGVRNLIGRRSLHDEKTSTLAMQNINIQPRKHQHSKTKSGMFLIFSSVGMKYIAEFIVSLYNISYLCIRNASYRLLSITEA